MQRVGAGRSISWLNTFNTYFRNINTIFNPEFIITNFTRDLQTGLFNLSADHKSLSKQVLKNIVKAQLGIRNNIKGKAKLAKNISNKEVNAQVKCKF